MALLHDAPVRSTIEARLKALRPTATAQWGKMNVGQMLWHVNEAMSAALGERGIAPGKVPLPKPVIKFLVLNMPWMRNAPTNPSLVATDTHAFEPERTRCLALIQRIAVRPIAGTWTHHPMFGKMSGKDVSRLHAKHLDHHLRQFGV